MEIYFPAYYNTFRCIAANCPDSCCKEWTVDVDLESAARYRALDGALGDRLRAVLQDTEDGTIMVIENGRCPMWREDSLCRIQAELGHDALCKTCREFPRIQHDYGSFKELGLELSCPEAARLILTASADMQTTICPGGEEPAYDTAVMEILKKSRQEALALADDPHFSFREALAILLLHAHTVQGQLDGCEEEAFVPKELLSEAKGYACPGDIKSIFAFFQGLEIMTEPWKSALAQPPQPICESDMLRAFLRYLICRYWLQAISDLDLVCRAKLIVVSCVLVASLKGDPIQIAQLFSKEIENDPENVAAILDGAYISPALTDSNLIGVLLE